MKNYIILALLVVSTGLMYSARFTEPTPAEQIEERFASRKSELLFRINACLSDLEHGRELQSSYQELRTAYKQWEYLAEFQDPDFVKDYLNGAPLPKLERNSFGLNVMEPAGLQVIDELMSSAHDNSSELLNQMKDFKQNVERFPAYRIQDYQVWAAAKSALIRVFTLSLSGFDTPGTSMGLSDAITTLKTVQRDLKLYQDMADHNRKGLFSSLMKSWDLSIHNLESNKNFNSFDRFGFYRIYLRKLFRQLFEVHRNSGIEFPSEIEIQPRPIGDNGLALFDSGFLNAGYFLKMPANFNNAKTLELGRFLFYDPILSSGIDRSCASCHHPDKAFTDGLSKSTATGFQGTLERNAPSLLNCVFSERYFHDMRVQSLEDQLDHVVTTTSEFNTTWHQILNKLSLSKEYKLLFSEAFGSEIDKPIPLYHVQYALSAFTGNLNGFNSPFDQWMNAETKTSEIPQEVMDGFNLFMGKAKCGTCHFAPVFNGLVPPWYNENESEVLGVPENPDAKVVTIDKDQGRAMGLWKEKVDFFVHSFKTPTVRNVELTAPYMHNGSYTTLEKVVDFYNKGGGRGLGLVVEHQTLPFDKLDLTEKEQAAIVLFMKSLTDKKQDWYLKPKQLPSFETHPEWNQRPIGGSY